MASVAMRSARLRRIARVPLQANGYHHQSTDRGYAIMTSESSTPNLVLTRGLFTTLDRSRPMANAVAIKDGRFLAVGRDEDVMPLAGVETYGHRPKGPPRAAWADRRAG